MRHDEEDEGGSGGEDASSRGRLNGVRAPADEYWSDEESNATARLARAGDASAEARVSGPWGTQAQRRLGGPRVEERVTAALLARLLAYALAYSLCLTGCEMLTMWASRRVSWALPLGLLGGALWSCVRGACLLALPFCWLCGYGLLKHPAVWKEMIPPRNKVLPEMCSGRIIFRHVCLADDAQPLAQACVAHTVSLLQRTLPDTIWRVELVCEGLPFWEPPPAVSVLAVPTEYAPANGTRGRSRALHYAAQRSAAAAGDWVVYLGAATVLRERTVDAILAHVVDEAYRLTAVRRHNERQTAYGRIAQGPMCVGQTGGSWAGFLSDTRRAGETHGILRWQYEAGEAWAGVNNSFLVVPKELELAVGFDQGAQAAEADLTRFALLCRDSGAHFAWLDAPAEEPASMTTGECLAQRRRAFESRLALLGASGAPGSLSTDRRVALAVMTVSATCAQLCLVVTALSVVIQHQVSVSELLVSFAISFCSGTVLFCFLLGFASSCSPLSFGGGPVGWAAFCALLLAQVLWAPAACFLELLACAQALRAHWQTDTWRNAR